MSRSFARWTPTIRRIGACASFPTFLPLTTATDTTSARCGRSSPDGLRLASIATTNRSPPTLIALLALDGSLGHLTEVLSGDYYQPLSTSSPHQIWSAAMVVSPILRGMLCLETDAHSHNVTLAPHLPADWRSFSLDNLRVGSTTIAARGASMVRIRACLQGMP